MGIAGTALIATCRAFTTASYTATQYALFSSMYALPGKLLMARRLRRGRCGLPCSSCTRRARHSALVMLLFPGPAARAGCGAP